MTTRLADGTIGDAMDLYSQKTQSLFLAWQNGEATQKQGIDSIVAFPALTPVIAALAVSFGALNISYGDHPGGVPDFHRLFFCDSGLVERIRSFLHFSAPDVVRAGVVSIPVTFSVSAKWLKILTEFKQQEKITVGYFDMETLAVKTEEMYIEGYKASLVKDTFRKGLWTVSFTLREI